MSLVFVVSSFSSAANSEVLIPVYKHSRKSQVHVKNIDEVHVPRVPKPQVL